ncbi:unnamed protein product [Toxocara canis]|uniref:Uncharacterized protein n=1 Tax=Toxocara canis TaxID=6265 RepID=A0A3P7GI60_TOXCA|nr:unnamed protein product [Toxocara canis]
MEEELGVDVNQSDEFGITPLMHACIVNSETIVRLLFDPNCMRKTSAVHISQITAKGASRGRRKRTAHQRVSATEGIFGGFLFGASNTSTPQLSSENAEERETSFSSMHNNSIVLNGDLDFKRTVSGGNLQKVFGSGDYEDANFLHFMIRPCAWENVSLLYAICEGVPAVVDMINPKNSGGGTPLMVARNLCQARMLDAMKKICKTADELEIEMAS